MIRVVFVRLAWFFPRVSPDSVFAGVRVAALFPRRHAGAGRGIEVAIRVFPADGVTAAVAPDFHFPGPFIGPCQPDPFEVVDGDMPEVGEGFSRVVPGEALQPLAGEAVAFMAEVLAAHNDAAFVNIALVVSSVAPASPAYRRVAVAGTGAAINAAG